MMRSFLLLPAAAAAVFLCTSCSMLIRQDPPPQQPKKSAGTPPPENGKKPGPEKGAKALTDREIAQMSPDELERYMEEKQRRERAKALSDDMAEGKLTERDRRRVRMNVSRPLTPEERGSAFPWKSEPGTRSESLRGTRTFNY